jgi:DNA-binding CsgD family transcriptional regulator
MTRIQAGFQRSRYPILILDDHRRWVTGNAAACEALDLTLEEIAWYSIEDFTQPDERERVDDRWATLVGTGALDGWYNIYLPGRGTLLVEFSATANVLPGRHLAYFLPVDEASSAPPDDIVAREGSWLLPASADGPRTELTAREREVLSLIASGLQTPVIAERLFVSTETVKSHVRNAMGKLGSHTRAHAVALALVTGQITWDLADDETARRN